MGNEEGIILALLATNILCLAWGIYLQIMLSKSMDNTERWIRYNAVLRGQIAYLEREREDDDG